MRPIDVTIKQMPSIIYRLKQKYPEQETGESLKIPFNKDGQVLFHGLSTLYRWDYSTFPAQRNKVVTDEYERDNFIFVEAMKIQGFRKASYVKMDVCLKDTDGYEYRMPITKYEPHINNVYGGWLVGQFQFVKFYNRYRIICIKNLFDEARET